ncbi:hypothetical protein E3N88_16542 [Mikania micrantha]|uniref:NADP-dependent oxidoreductase domain-containing protein n=1 Tax=Mikania micrantha TaxID=192012 RepID=A0A5N6NZ29_9ASTR|nr:hypothetical protein E3N88_16542 [Mikania micrantha]
MSSSFHNPSPSSPTHSTIGCCDPFLSVASTLSTPIPPNPPPTSTTQPSPPTIPVTTQTETSPTVLTPIEPTIPSALPQTEPSNIIPTQTVASIVPQVPSLSPTAPTTTATSSHPMITRAKDAMSDVKKIKLGSQGLEVSAIGLGCMGMSGGYGPVKLEAEMIGVIHHAINSGVTHLDTSDVYGPQRNEILVGKAEIHGEPEYVRACCEASLKRLDVDYIDLYYVHRIDTKVPIEITMGELKKLVEEGKIKYIGLSKAGPATSRRAHDVHPITAVQLEWSLWTRDVEDEVIPTCRSNPWYNLGALGVKLTAQDMVELESMASFKGARMPEQILVHSYKNSDTPLLSSWKSE